MVFLRKNRVLARIFQKIDIKEPSIEETVSILKGIKSHFEQHHQIRYTGAALRAAAELAGGLFVIASYRIKQLMLLMRQELTSGYYLNVAVKK